MKEACLKAVNVWKVLFSVSLLIHVSIAHPSSLESSEDDKEDPEEMLIGPAKDLPVHDDVKAKEPWELPMEHRHQDTGQIMLPDIKSVPDDVFQSLGVDLFFSMWFIFLNDNVTYSDKPFTILAPVNSSKTSPEELLGNESLCEEIILNHILLGEDVRPEELHKPQERFTSGGQRLHFKVDKEGEIWVNDVKIIGWSKVENGIIMATSNYLYTDDIEATALPRESLNSNEINGDDTTTKTTTSTSTSTSTTTTTTTTTTTKTTTIQTEPPTTSWTVSNDIIKLEKCHVVRNKATLFKSVEVCVEEFVDPKSDEGKEILSKNVDRKQIQPREEKLPDFIQDIVDVFSVLRFASNDFLEYIQKINIKDSFESDQKYTALIPYDEAFRSWYPIDWGFNPFDVEEFTRETILNHFVVGDVEKSSISHEPKTLKTLGGQEVVFKRDKDGKIMVNGVELLEGGTTVPHGEILFLGKLLFVTNEKVKKLNQEYEYLESAPLVPKPWFKSQFLSHAFKILSEKEEFSYMTNYMNATNELGNYVEAQGSDSTEGFTFFVPRDDAFWRIMVKDAAVPDPFMLDEEFRIQTLLGHLVSRKLFSRDLAQGTEIETMRNQSLRVSSKDGEIFLNDGRQNIKILGSEKYVYNLGTIFFIDRILFTETSDILTVLEKYEDELSIQDDDESESKTLEEFELDDKEEKVSAEKKIFDHQDEKSDDTSIFKQNSPEATEPLRDNRREVSQEGAEEFLLSKSELIIPEEWEDYEEKVIFINNQKVTILRQKVSSKES